MTLGAVCSSLYNWFSYENKSSENHVIANKAVGNPILGFSFNKEQLNQSTFFFEITMDDGITNQPSLSLNFKKNDQQTRQPIACLNGKIDNETAHSNQYTIFYQQIHDFIRKKEEEVNAKTMKIYFKIIWAVQTQANALCRYSFALHSLDDATFKNEPHKWILVFKKIEKYIKEAFTDVKELFLPIYGGCMIDAGMPAFLVKRFPEFNEPIQTQNVNSRKSFDYLSYLLKVAKKDQVKNIINMIIEKRILYKLVLDSGKSMEVIYNEYLPDSMDEFYINKVSKIGKKIVSEN